MKYVQIEDGKIISVFCCPQDPKGWPGYEEVDDDDPRYIAYAEWFKSVFGYELE